VFTIREVILKERTIPCRFIPVDVFFSREFGIACPAKDFLHKKNTSLKTPRCCIQERKEKTTDMSITQINGTTYCNGRRYDIPRGGHLRVTGSGVYCDGVLLQPADDQGSGSGGFYQCQSVFAAAGGTASHSMVGSASHDYTTRTGSAGSTERINHGTVHMPDGGTVVGDYNTITGSRVTVVGSHNHVNHVESAQIDGDYNTVSGNHVVVTGDHCHIRGDHCSAQGDYNTIIGDDARANGDHIEIRGMVQRHPETTSRSRETMAPRPEIIATCPVPTR
jgi:hypothetical protein